MQSLFSVSLGWTVWFCNLEEFTTTTKLVKWIQRSIISKMSLARTLLADLYAFGWMVNDAIVCFVVGCQDLWCWEDNFDTGENHPIQNFAGINIGQMSDVLHMLQSSIVLCMFWWTGVFCNAEKFNKPPIDSKRLVVNARVDYNNNYGIYLRCWNSCTKLTNLCQTVTRQLHHLIHLILWDVAAETIVWSCLHPNNRLLLCTRNSYVFLACFAFVT